MRKFNLKIGIWYKNKYGGIFLFNGKFDSDGDPRGLGFATDEHKNIFLEDEPEGWSTDEIRELNYYELEFILHRLKTENIKR